MYVGVPTRAATSASGRPSQHKPREFSKVNAEGATVVTEAILPDSSAFDIAKNALLSSRFPPMRPN